jgi:ASC-1-like (ASCH) protein
VTSLDEETNVSVHERYGHGDMLSIGEGKIRVESHLLDEREDVWKVTDEISFNRVIKT